jgi:transcriptional regulator GlxA family with amidase domain
MKKLTQDYPNTKIDRCFSIGMVLLPEFNGLAANAFIDPFRIANYVHSKRIYSRGFWVLRVHSVRNFFSSLQKKVEHSTQ